MPPRGKGGGSSVLWPRFPSASRFLPRVPVRFPASILYSGRYTVSARFPPVSRCLRESRSAFWCTPVFRVRWLCRRPACFLARFTAPTRVPLCLPVQSCIPSALSLLPSCLLPCLFHGACTCSCTFPCPDPVFRAVHCPCPLPVRSFACFPLSAACAGAFSGAGKENGRKGRNPAGNHYLCSGFRRAARSRAPHREFRFFYY